MKKIWISKQFLEQEYLQNRKSTIVIANELGLCSNTVRRRLRDFGISRRTISESRIGMQLSEKHKQNIKKGMFGITRSKNARKNYSRSKLGKLNPQWKGNDVGYGALHAWVSRRKLKPELCECCFKTTPYDLSNISGNYRRDINDFAWLCRSCHRLKDIKEKIHCKDFEEGV